MDVKMSVSYDGKVKISTGSERVRKDDLKKWLGRNDDAVLVKLKGQRNPSAPCAPGHICRIEEDGDQYSVFVGKYVIGQLPEEALDFAKKIDYSPEFMISIVGKVESDDVFIYIAE